ncbi:MAG: hypothetical protein M1836_007001 [Candelina mexicana]|nr:MAG: hypothetical protein M1836_007001 [Candelina mexicana]
MVQRSNHFSSSLHYIPPHVISPLSRFSHAHREGTAKSEKWLYLKRERRRALRREYALSSWCDDSWAKEHAQHELVLDQEGLACYYSLGYEEATVVETMNQTAMRTLLTQRNNKALSESLTEAMKRHDDAPLNQSSDPFDRFIDVKKPFLSSSTDLPTIKRLGDYHRLDDRLVSGSAIKERKTFLEHSSHHHAYLRMSRTLALFLFSAE